MSVYNPFDFFLEPAAENYPFTYRARGRRGTGPLPGHRDTHPGFAEFIASIDRTEVRTIDFSWWA